VNDPVDPRPPALELSSDDLDDQPLQGKDLASVRETLTGIAAAITPEPPMGKAYRDLVNRIHHEQQKLAQVARIGDETREARLSRTAARLETLSSNPELEAMVDVANGIEDLIAAQIRGADQLESAVTLIGNLDATIREGNRGSDRQARLALTIAVASIVISTILGGIAIWVQLSGARLP
jgi:hypothetical protein